MYEFEHDTRRHTRAPNRPVQHCHEIDTTEPTATLDAAEWEAIGAFLDKLSPEVYASQAGSLYVAFKLQTTVGRFVDALVSAGYYNRE